MRVVDQQGSSESTPWCPGLEPECQAENLGDFRISAAYCAIAWFHSHDD